MALAEVEVQARQASEETLRVGRQARMEALQFAKQVEDTFGIPFIAQRLEQYPEEIRHQQNAIKAAKQAVAEAREEVEYQETLLRAEIANAINPVTSKAAYSNDEARKTELTCRKRVSAPYKEAMQKLRAAEDAMEGAQFDYDKLVRKFGATMAASELATGRLKLLSR